MNDQEHFIIFLIVKKNVYAITLRQKKIILISGIF